MRLALLLLFCALFAASAEIDFRVVTADQRLIEGGHVEKMTIINGQMEYTLFPPRLWPRQVDEAGRKIVFTSPSGTAGLIIHFTALDRGSLPDKDTLKERALRAHPGATFMHDSVCPSGLGKGVCFDLFHRISEQLTQKIRHAYVPGPDGLVELVLTSSSDEFERQTFVLMSAARDLSGERIKAKAAK